MKTLKSVVPGVLGLFLVFTVICGIVFPLAVTGIARVFFPLKAGGSILTGEDGTKYGSGLVGQQFTGNEYLWGRIMILDTASFTGKDGKPLLYAAPSNKSPAEADYGKLVAERVEKIRKAQPEHGDEPIPVDLVTCSGSGLDPAVSPAAAEFQVSRIARARGISEDDVRAVIKKYTTGRFLGIFGEPAVNVLKVNLTLDGIRWK